MSVLSRFLPFLPVLALAVAALLRVAWPAAAADAESVRRGAYLFNAGNCRVCHTDTRNGGALLAGGRALKTPFGTFYGPNITPHPEFGIGAWSDADFIRAMRRGVSPEGPPYYPAFPYTSFTGMTDRDLKDLKAYIFTLPPVAQESRPHELDFPYRLRWGLWLWRAAFFEPGPFTPDPARSEEWNRGAYLVHAVAHCGECHTPRGRFGQLDRSRWMAGAEKGTGPEGEPTPNITPHPEKGIGNWSVSEIMDALEFGMLPDGDEFGALMADVVKHGTSKMTAADRRAIAIYLKSLKPIAGAGTAK